ncbi:hypothetical protein [Jannaschia pohangensis]|uniref:Lipoprotein n=1 Tax=Jannaschia pohangensis TaxID=390807 RepID=A0A1I3QXT1_9RHOB|nr:hypothetical protein [Jannaschia pohangensis]SFJ39033.1 hypothetical protein SAMN04488095_2718 [Jannaschia pohangensis]
MPDGPILPGDPPAQLRRLAIAPISAVSVAVVLSACMPTTPEARRATYLDCARKQGVAVEGQTIRIRKSDDLRRLDACEAIPR